MIIIKEEVLVMEGLVDTHMEGLVDTHMEALNRIAMWQGIKNKHKKSDEKNKINKSSEIHRSASVTELKKSDLSKSLSFDSLADPLIDSDVNKCQLASSDTKKTSMTHSSPKFPISFLV